MPVTIGLVGGGLALGGGVGSFLGGKDQAESQKAGAQLQADIAREGIAEQKATREQNLKMFREFQDTQERTRSTALKLSSPSFAELSSLNRLLQIQDMAVSKGLASIDRNLSLIDSIDPAIKEAGTQILGLMKGKEASVLAPLRDQRNREKQKLTETLRDRLGPGFATSTAGSDALNKFDQDTSNILNNAQFSAIGQFGQLIPSLSGARPNIAGEIASTFGTAANIGTAASQGFQNIQQRAVNAFTGVPLSPPPIQTPVDFSQFANAAGIARSINPGAQAFGDFSSGLGSFGGGLAGISLAGYLTNPKPSAPPGAKTG